eukprot:TRINITY_DN7360_c0_g1_i2.p1 TRINITY_DN7360_c0_g1~~TRINITY_DN7360_c0_g1_i2.p1  ORF type:complete len:237 (+),score=64.68 TRINITY_DN7360_c0_g1_i2:213-923(+)
MIGRIKERFPKHKFLAEESFSPQHQSKSGSIYNFSDEPTWIIDPVDGTTNFVHGYPWVCVSIGFAVKKEVVVGVVVNPILKETFHAMKGGGAFLNGKRINVSNAKELSQSVVSTNFGYDRTEEGADFMLGNIRTLLMENVQSTRSEGSAAVALCSVALGRLDAFYEFGIHPWDIAAGVLIVKEAGGVAIDPLNGGSLHLESRRILVSNPHVGEKIALLLQRTPVPSKYAVVLNFDN